MYYSSSPEEYLCKWHRTWYKLCHYNSGCETEITIEKAKGGIREDLCMELDTVDMAYLCEMSKKAKLTLYSNRKSSFRPIHQWFNEDKEGFEVCSSRLSVSDNGIICKRYRLLDTYQLVNFDIYANSKGICHAELKYDESYEDIDYVGMNLNMPTTIAMSTEENRVFELMARLSKTMQTGELVMSHA